MESSMKKCLKAECAAKCVRFWTHKRWLLYEWEVVLTKCARFCHQRSSSTKGCLQPKVVFHQRSSSHRRLSSNEGCLPTKVVFRRRVSSTEGRLPMKVSSTYHNTLIDLIFVRAVNIPNLSLLPAMHDAWCMMVEDNLQWKTTFGGRWPSVEDNLRGRRPSVGDSLQWKTTFGGRWP